MRAVFNLIVFVFSAALVALAIRKVAPEPRVPIVTSKITYLKEHGDEFDVLFLGSSRTYRQIICESFDGILAAAGQRVRSFNLGVDGMRPPEDSYVLERALRGRTKPLRWVLVECSPLRVAVRDEDRGTLRASYWHDFRRTATVFRRAFFADEKKRKFRDRIKDVVAAWPSFQEHGEYFLENFAHLGRGYMALENLLLRGGQVTTAMWELGTRRDGYRPSDQPERMRESEEAVYRQQLAAMRAKPPRLDFGDAVSQEELREKQRLIENAGGKMVLVMPPYAAKRFFYPKPANGSSAPLILDLSSVEKYPALYAPENRSDSGHLNRAGSEIYTREIARLLLEQLH
jgi:hypothetical protein